MSLWVQAIAALKPQELMATSSPSSRLLASAREAARALLASPNSPAHNRFYFAALDADRWEQFVAQFLQPVCARVGLRGWIEAGGGALSFPRLRSLATLVRPTFLSRTAWAGWAHL